jgi:hypothetical protein
LKSKLSTKIISVNNDKFVVLSKTIDDSEYSESLSLISSISHVLPETTSKTKIVS